MFKHFFRIISKIISFPSTLIYFTPKYYYEDKTVQKKRIKGKTIIALNHKKPVDMVLMLHVFWPNYLRVLVGETIYEKNKFLKSLLYLLGAVKVSRLDADMSFMKTAVAILNKNGKVVIFPEARLPINDEMLPFKYSAVYMALQSGAPIIPIYQDGNYGLFKRVRVVIGKPIYYNELDKNPNNEVLEKYTKELKNKVKYLKTLIECEKHA